MGVKMDCSFCGKPLNNNGTSADPVWECTDIACPGTYPHKKCRQCGSGPAKVVVQGLGDMDFVCSKGHTYR